MLHLLICALLCVHSFSTTLDADSSDRATSLDRWTVDGIHKSGCSYSHESTQDGRLCEV